tara:strand:- start:42 stop:1124 length:1083 start_codon:yes stop_codon:yes gene_type:complete
MKNVQQVFVATTTDTSTAVASLAAGAFAVIDGATDTAVANITAVTGSYYYFALGTSGTTIVSDMFPTNFPGDNLPLTAPLEVTAVDGVDKIVTYNMGTVQCETEYIMKFRLEGEKIAKTYGYNDLIKMFSYTTLCCNDCATACPTGGAGDLALGLMNEINAWDTTILTAQAYDVSSGSGVAINTAVQAAAFDAAVVAGSKDATDAMLIIWGQSYAAAQAPTVGAGFAAEPLSDVGINYEIGLTGGFECNGAAVTTATGSSNTAYVKATGEDYQIELLQQEASGYKRNHGVYRNPFPYGTFTGNGTVVAGTDYDLCVAPIRKHYQGADSMNLTDSVTTIKVAIPTGGSSAASLSNLGDLFK